MSTSLSVGQKVALATAVSIPSGYAWLRWKHPTLLNDFRGLLRIRNAFNALTKFMEAGNTFVDLVEKHAQERPSHPCVLYENEMYTYAEVVWNMNRTARWIRSSDPSLKTGDVICVLLYNGPTMLWTWLGLMKMGVIASLINYNLTGDALLHCIRASEPKKLIIGSGEKLYE